MKYPIYITIFTCILQEGLVECRGTGVGGRGSGSRSLVGGSGYSGSSGSSGYKGSDVWIYYLKAFSSMAAVALLVVLVFCCCIRNKNNQTMTQGRIIVPAPSEANTGACRFNNDMKPNVAAINVAYSDAKQFNRNGEDSDMQVVTIDMSKIRSYQELKNTRRYSRNMNNISEDRSTSVHRSGLPTYVDVVHGGCSQLYTIPEVL